MNLFFPSINVTLQSIPILQFYSVFNDPTSQYPRFMINYPAGEDKGIPNPSSGIDFFLCLFI